jgi:hypothetical protein
MNISGAKPEAAVEALTGPIMLESKPVVVA